MWRNLVLCLLAISAVEAQNYTNARGIPRLNELSFKW